MLKVGDAAEAAVKMPALEKKHHGFETLIFRTLRSSVRKYCLGTMSESSALSAVLRRRRVRNMSVVRAIPLAKSASTQGTLTHIVSATGNHRLSHVR
jgi:hypothetical protein